MDEEATQAAVEKQKAVLEAAMTSCVPVDPETRLQMQLMASQAAALETEERIVELEKELREERETFKREWVAFVQTHHHETNTRELAEKNADEWRSLCLGLLEISFAVIEQLSVDLAMASVHKESNRE